MDKIEKLDLTFLDEDIAGILTRLCCLEDKVNELVERDNEKMKRLQDIEDKIIKIWYDKK